MASARDDGSNPARENVKELRRFQELYVGRFNTKEAVAIMERFNYDANAAVNFFQTGPKEAEIQELIKDVEADVDLTCKLRELKMSGASYGRIDTTTRQFACEPCDRMWWRRTPKRKQVSKCFLCLERYDPVPREKEWGWAQFECPNCQNKFSGHCSMENTSPCYNCKTEVKPFLIEPPMRRRGRRSRKPHKCDAEDCEGECSLQSTGSARGHRGGSGGRRGFRTAPPPPRNGSTGGGDLRNTDPGDAADYDRSQGTNADGARGPVPSPGPPQQPVPCVYPSPSRRRRVVVASQPHCSSGSTVDTFLTQGDLDRGSDTNSQMPPIYEN